jgi:hypothetical protein
LALTCCWICRPNSKSLEADHWLGPTADHWPQKVAYANQGKGCREAHADERSHLSNAVVLQPSKRCKSPYSSGLSETGATDVGESYWKTIITNVSLGIETFLDQPLGYDLLIMSHCRPPNARHTCKRSSKRLNLNSRLNLPCIGPISTELRVEYTNQQALLWN